MNTEIPIRACVASLIFCLQGLDAAEPAFRDAATHTSLAEIARKHADPLQALKAAVPSRPIVAEPTPEPVNLIERSAIPCFGGKVTLIPKRSVIHTPAQFGSRFGYQEGNALVGWREFHPVNRGWIDTVEVSRPQAEGREALPEDWAKLFEKRNKVVVAVFQGAPISVLPFTPPPSEPTDAPR